MTIRIPGPLCGFCNESFESTPGTTGLNDPWDVTLPVRSKRYGNGPTGVFSLPQVAAGGTKSKSNNPTLIVHKKSRLKAKELFTWLKKSKYLSKKVRVRLKISGNKIIFPSNISSSNQWTKDLLSIENQWEITTGTLTIILDLNGVIRGQDIEANITRQQHNVVDFTKQGKSGSKQNQPESRGTIRDDSSEKKARSSLHNSPAEMKGDFTRRKGGGLLLGKTVPSFGLSDGKSMTEIVDLQSSKGLVIVVDGINVKKGLNLTEDLIKVPNEIVEENLIHELAAHAGLFSQRKDAEHGNKRVESNTKAIIKIVDNSTLEKELINKVQLYINAMKAH